MNLYLAGPMRGIADYNYPAFNAMAERLRAVGHTVFNPAEHHHDGWGFAEYMAQDLAEVCKAHAVAVLPFWRESQGARMEVFTARELGKKVYDAEALVDGMMVEAQDAPPAASNGLPTDARARKGIPLWRGLLGYFPDACSEVARLSYVANEQHNPGEEMHWAREKSTDHEDCIMRHMMQADEVDVDGFLHAVKVAWRGLALAQVAIEKQAEKGTQQ